VARAGWSRTAPLLTARAPYPPVNAVASARRGDAFSAVRRRRRCPLRAPATPAAISGAGDPGRELGVTATRYRPDVTDDHEHEDPDIAAFESGDFDLLALTPADHSIGPGGSKLIVQIDAEDIGRLHDRAQQEGVTISALVRRHLNTILGKTEPAIPLVILQRFIDRQAHSYPTCPAEDRVPYVEADELESLLSRYEDAVVRRGETREAFAPCVICGRASIAQIAEHMCDDCADLYVLCPDCSPREDHD